MKNSYISKLTLLAALLLGWNTSLFAQPSTFYNVGGMQTYTVPAGITSVTVDAYGAMGGYAVNYYNNGGYGAYVHCTLAVNPGDVLNVYVGGQGGTGYYCCYEGYGGYNGGGSAAYSYGGGGGGGSDIRYGGTDPSYRVIVAGGGGGAGSDCNGGGEQGGAGGDLYAQGGNDCYNPSYYSPGNSGQGGTPYYGGQGGYYGGAGSGNFFSGGYAEGNGGGGGGGYYGGGGGYYGGGGGGSSYGDPSVVSNYTGYQGYNYGDGTITITPNCTAGTITGTLSTCVGFTTTLSDNPSDPSGAWTSADNSIATVDASGNVTGVAAGTVAISYGGSLACGTVYTSVNVTVVAVPSGISGPATICQAQTASYSSGTGGTWTTSDGTIATIDPVSGVAFGVAPGVATISYAVSATCYVTQLVTVLETAPITGTNNVCAGLTINLADGVSGGTWSSNNTSVATVDPSLGVVTGVEAGFPTISYTGTNGCIVSDGITVNPLPAAFTGTSSVCQGLTTILGETSTGGGWTSSTTTIATVVSGSATTGKVTGVTAGTSSITYKLPTGCLMASTVTVNPLPAAIAGNQNICVGLTDTMSDATPLGAWSASNGNASIDPSSGAALGLTTGPLVITYTLPTSCIATMTATVQPIPASITGNTTVCVNSVSLLSDASSGGGWTSDNTSQATIGAGTGALAGVSAGSPNITYTLPTGCLISTVATVNPAPSTISGGTNVCVGSSSTLTDGGLGTWSSSNTGLATVGLSSGIVTGVVMGSPVITYTLPVTGCQKTDTITVLPVPAPITGATSECSGLSTTLNDVTPGGTWSSTSPAFATVDPGGDVTATATPGTTNINYTVTTGGTACLSTLTFTNTPLPTNYTTSIAGGATSASYCPGPLGTPVPHIVTSSSDIGVQYQLYNGGIAVSGMLLEGTGSSLDFGPQPEAGIYVIIATNMTTGCTRTLPGTPSISINALPIVDTLEVANGGNYCGVSGSVDISGTSSVSGQTYLLYSSGGVIAGVVPGTTGLPADFGTYQAGVYTGTVQNATCTSPMIGTVTVTENALPIVYNVTGGGNYCTGTPGVHITMDNSSTGIDYYLYNSGSILPVDSLHGSNSSLDFGNQLTGGGPGSTATFTVVAVNSITGCTSNMAGSETVTENVLPTSSYVVSTPGSSSFCAGGGGVDIQLSNSDNFINYQLYDGLAAVGGSVTGSGGLIDFGAQPITGIYTVVGKDPTTSCKSTMTGNVNVTTYPAIPVDTLKGGGSYCAGGAGKDIMLNSSAGGIEYYLYNAGILIDSLPGVDRRPLDFGLDTLSGAYTVIAVNPISGCSGNMAGSPVITINSLPVAYSVTVTGGGSYCAGSPGVDIGLGFSDVGINYQLYRGGTIVGSSLAGSSSALDFGTVSIVGTYIVRGTNVITTCSSAMANSAIVNLNAQPIAYAVTGGGSYCAGGTGKHVGLFKTDTGITYQLYNGSKSGIAVAGTGATIDFGLQTATGTYTVIASNNTTGCSNDITGSVVITTNPLPVSYNVTGGGGYCTGGAGMPVGLSGSNTGIRYQLYNSGSLLGTLSGTTGIPLNFGLEKTAGTYTVIATNTTSGCTSNMSDSAIIVINSLPNVYAVTGGGAYCAGTGGSDIGLKGSDAGINYQPFNGGVPAGLATTGNGLALDLGLQTAAGGYTVVATNAATGCTAIMAGGTVVSVNALPDAYTVTGSGHFCAGGAGIPVILTGSHTGISYQLYNGIALSGLPVVGTDGAITLGTPATTGIYTAVGTNIATGCSSNMAGTGDIVVDALPSAFPISGGGHYCGGGAGVLVNLTGSVAGINYQLYNGLTLTDLPVGGTGLPITFGLETGGGTYTIVGTNNTTGCVNNMTGSVDITVDPVVTPSVSIATSTGDDTACIGTVTTYTAAPVNGGATPSYQWTVNGIPTVAVNPFSYIALAGDVVGVTMTSDAACVTVAAASRSLTMNVIPYQTPSANITITPGNNVCHGTTVKLNATTDFGGSTPGYMWLKNSIPVGAGTSYSYTPGTANNGDVLIFMLTSSYRCRTVHTDSVFSNNFVMTVDSAQAPRFSIDSHFGPILVGQVDTFMAIDSNAAGTILTYQWEINGMQVPGASSALFIDNNVFNGDIVSCDVTRIGACGNETASKSWTVVTLKNVGVQQVSSDGSDISVLPNPNKGAFTVKGTLGTTEDEEVSLEITDMLGQVVYKSKVMAHNGNLDEHLQMSAGLANGMYLLSVHSAAANNVYHIVIEQ